MLVLKRLPSVGILAKGLKKIKGFTKDKNGKYVAARKSLVRFDSAVPFLKSLFDNSGYSFYPFVSVVDGVCVIGLTIADLPYAVYTTNDSSKKLIQRKRERYLEKLNLPISVYSFTMNDLEKICNENPEMPVEFRLYKCLKATKNDFVDISDKLVKIKQDKAKNREFVFYFKFDKDVEKMAAAFAQYINKIIAHTNKQ